MTKEQLKRYRELKLELQDINAGISNSTIHDSVSGSKKEFPWTIGTRHVEGVPDEDYDLLVRKSDLKAQIKEIEDFANGIDDYKIRKAIRIYYMEPLDESCEKPTWESIANKFYDGSTGDSIRISVQRYLKKN